MKSKYFGKLDAGQSFFKPLAWHYYLPAYLIQCVRRRIFSSIGFAPTTESDFESYEDFIRYYNDWEQSRIDLLTQEQIKTIISYLEIVLKVNENWEDDKTALNFWKETYNKSFSLNNCLKDEL